MKIEDRVTAFAKLSDFLHSIYLQDISNIDNNLLYLFDKFNLSLIQAERINPWFTKDFVLKQIFSLSEMTKKEKLLEWLKPYPKFNQLNSKRIAVIFAGNIALVGFHDFITILITGFNILIKLSSKDNILPQLIAEILIKIEPRFEEKIQFETEKIKDFDAVIATGSNNSARYFEFYFSKVPNIIRRSRNSFAVISGQETIQELEMLADDIFLYYGLGCRNISKIFIPINYDFNLLFQVFYKYKDISNHNKYINNYDYQKTIFLMNSDKFLDNNFFLVKENNSLFSPIAVLHYEYYDNYNKIVDFYNSNINSIQCVATNIDNLFSNSVLLGKTQYPELTDYEDNINTLDFLSQI